MDGVFKLNAFLTAAKKQLSSIEHKTAVFDADGTLWKEDIGWGFFNYQIQNQMILKNQTQKSIEKLYLNSPQKTCAMIVQANKGIPLSQYISWVKDYLKTNPLHVFSFQRKIIQFLKSQNTKIYVVSASPEWALVEALRYYELPIDHALGFKTHLKKGVITDNLQYPLPYGSGKMTAFLQAEKNTCPFFASGNSMSDLDIMELSSHFRLAVASASPGHRQYDSERVLMSLARRKSWLQKDMTKEDRS